MLSQAAFPHTVPRSATLLALQALWNREYTDASAVMQRYHRTSVKQALLPLGRVAGSIFLRPSAKMNVSLVGAISHCFYDSRF